LSTPKRTRLPAAERREIILTAATEIFAERGYVGASIDEIARASGVSPPVVYDHFASKQELHRFLLERQRDALLAFWREHLPSAPEGRRISWVLDRLLAYVEANPYVSRMYYRETTGDPEVAAFHRAIHRDATTMLAALLAQEPGWEDASQPELEMATELIRTGVIGLALWWQERPEIPRAEVVAAATRALGGLREAS
jgi:AcrR family transcriptional regulator